MIVMSVLNELSTFSTLLIIINKNIEIKERNIKHAFYC